MHTHLDNRKVVTRGTQTWQPQWRSAKYVSTTTASRLCIGAVPLSHTPHLAVGEEAAPVPYLGSLEELALIGEGEKGVKRGGERRRVRMLSLPAPTR